VRAPGWPLRWLQTGSATAATRERCDCSRPGEPELRRCALLRNPCDPCSICLARRRRLGTFAHRSSERESGADRVRGR
jgi:hypothetical protein